jgi:hypothetical protein
MSCFGELRGNFPSSGLLSLYFRKSALFLGQRGLEFLGMHGIHVFSSFIAAAWASRLSSSSEYSSSLELKVII